MRVADAIFRQGHLSERALIEAYMTGDRAAHLERCRECADRLVQLGHWMDGVRTAGLEEADAAFPAERLSAQQSQILRRLEQLDRPARVITFPGQSRYDKLEPVTTGIRPAWVGVAAAAGIVLGLLGGEINDRLAERNAPPPAQVQQVPATASVAPNTASEEDLPLLPLDVNDRTRISSVSAIDAYTPNIVRTSGLVLSTEQ